MGEFRVRELADVDLDLVPVALVITENNEAERMTVMMGWRSEKWMCD